MIDALNLAPRAHAAALLLLAAHPEVVFTSGRRDLAGQASAMASNVIRNPHWIFQTYKPTAERNALQAWVDAHFEAATQAGIAAGLLSVMSAWTDGQLARVSKHLSGLAFDVQPVVGAAGEAIKATIRSLPGLVEFLEVEGGLIRWHAQFA